jgi:predicted RNA-binding protein with PIN domain
MIILVDAYNLLKTVLHVKFISDAQREQFLQVFAKYAQHRPTNTVILVFDGGPDLYEVENFYKQMTIIYAGSLQIADDVIKKKLYELRSQDVLLVTCDREIRRYAAQYQIESLGSVEFYNILQTSMQQHDQKEVIIAQTICKTSSGDNQDLDRLMELGSRRLVMKDQDKQIQVVMKHTQQLGDTKKDKKLLRKIAKI